MLPRPEEENKETWILSTRSQGIKMPPAHHQNCSNLEWANQLYARPTPEPKGANPSISNKQEKLCSHFQPHRHGLDRRPAGRDISCIPESMLAQGPWLKCCYYLGLPVPAPKDRGFFSTHSHGVCQNGKWAASACALAIGSLSGNSILNFHGQKGE